MTFYPEGSPPVLVGHYKIQGAPLTKAPQAACLDYSETPCVYRWRGEEAQSESQVVLVT